MVQTVNAFDQYICGDIMALRWNDFDETCGSLPLELVLYCPQTSFVVAVELISHPRRNIQ